MQNISSDIRSNLLIVQLAGFLNDEEVELAVNQNWSHRKVKTRYHDD